ncbi:alpha/beta hydrolase [Desulfoluna spongiiphila]|uniref:Serine aminopeptidase, S33 n=1 Tax=Desulfoluna spongiiphila TaxID=419481 RepID=A0A1G5E8K1_9BACT|nr:alpha/beta hydrolase [Desulfoluna spongiiphila]SCY23030.1 Serine aminopeptidase, S33 [Desulfoluna spongiiphila]
MMNMAWTHHPMPGGVTVEAAWSPCSTPRSKGCVVLWPCMGGDCRMYAMPVESFTSAGWHVLFYNPRGHGGSTGYLSVATAGDDLKRLLDHFGLSGLPLSALGHSGACAAWLKAAAAGLPVKDFYFAAPVINSRRSLFYMYEAGTIGEFVFVTSRLAADPVHFKRILADTDWLDPSYWHENNLEDVLNGTTGTFPMGSFLRELFIPGVDAMPELVGRASDVTVFFPARDNWYPHRETLDGCPEHLTAVAVEAARDHYFSCGWDSVWAETVSRLVSQRG